MKSKSEYAQAGVDYKKIEPFKRIMQEMGRRTLSFPRGRGVVVESDEHGAAYFYQGIRRHRWACTQEGLGNKNWIAEWMYQNAGTGRTYYDGIGADAALMAANDVIAQGAMPVIYTDEVAAGDSDWFNDEKRARDLAESYFRICGEVGMALPAGESPSLRYLVKAEPPVRSAPSLSGCVTGIIVPFEPRIHPRALAAGDFIIGISSSGIHANGISLVIKKAMELPEKFLTKLPSGNTLGEEALIPTRSYVALVEALLARDIEIHGLLPGTGSGVGKLAFAKRPFSYRVCSWLKKIPPLFEFMRELGVSLEDCLTTFNWGIGYYVFVPVREAYRTVEAAQSAGYEASFLGVVEEGERKVIFDPGHLTLPPLGA